jgi:hypothetical protein
MYSRQRRIWPYKLPVGFLPEEWDVSAMHHVERILHDARGIGGCLIGGKTGGHEDDTMDEDVMSTSRRLCFWTAIHSHVPSFTGLSPHMLVRPSICSIDSFTRSIDVFPVYSTMASLDLPAPAGRPLDVVVVSPRARSSGQRRYLTTLLCRLAAPSPA